MLGIEHRIASHAKEAIGVPSSGEHITPRHRFHDAQSNRSATSSTLIFVVIRAGSTALLDVL
jgi:hypothetical protein